MLSTFLVYIQENNKSLFQLAEEAEDCGNVFAKVRSISDVLVEALSVEGSAFTEDTLLNVAYILREYSDIAEAKINALEKDLRGAFDRFECLS